MKNYFTRKNISPQTRIQLDEFYDSIIIAQHKDINFFFSTILNSLNKIFKARIVTIWDYLEFSDTLVMIKSNPERYENHGTATILAEHSLSGLAIAEKTPQIFTRLNKNKSVKNRFFQNPSILEDYSIKSMISLPVLNYQIQSDKLISNGTFFIINIYYDKNIDTKCPLTLKELNRLLISVFYNYEYLMLRRSRLIKNVVSDAVSKAHGIAESFSLLLPYLLEYLNCKNASLLSYDHVSDSFYIERSNDFSRSNLIGPENPLPIDDVTEANTHYQDVIFQCVKQSKPYFFCIEDSSCQLSSKNQCIPIYCIYLAIPVFSSNREVIGIIECWEPFISSERIEISFSNIDNKMLTYFGEYISPYFEKYLRIRDDSPIVRIVNQVMISMAKGIDLFDSLQNGLSQIVIGLNAQHGSLYLFNGDKTALTLVAAVGPKTKMIGKASYMPNEGLTGEIAAGNILNLKTEKEIIEHPNFSGKYDEVYGGVRLSNNFLGVPIKFQNEVLGALKVSSIKDPEYHGDLVAYTDDDVHAARTVSSLLGFLVKRFENEYKEVNNLLHLAETTVNIESAESINEAVNQILGSMENIGYNEIFLAFYNKDINSLEKFISNGDNWDPLENLLIKPFTENNILTVSLKENKEFFINYNDNFFCPDSNSKKQIEPYSLYIIPLRISEEKIGVIVLNMKNKTKIGKNEALLLKAFSRHLAISVSRIKNFRSALEMTETIMSNSRFIVAETLSAMAVHSMRHRLLDIQEDLRDDLKQQHLRQNKLIFEKFTGWDKKFSLLYEEIDEALQFVKSEKRSIAEKVNIFTTIQESIDIWYHYIQNKKCKIHKKNESDTSICRLSKRSFLEIMSILIVNSIQAYSKNIYITLKSRPNYEITKSFKHDAVIVEFIDDGNGILTDDPNQLFLSDYTTKPANQGTGLGLFIAKGLAKQNAGNITYSKHKKTQKKGACFNVIFPIISR